MKDILRREENEKRKIDEGTDRHQYDLDEHPVRRMYRLQRDPFLNKINYKKK